MPLFPYKLNELLTEMQSNARLSPIISWTHSGNAFKIHEPLLFEEILLQKYFPRQTQINSFKRQLLYYGFDNLGNGIFAHPCFLKDKRHLCGQINHTNPTKSQREGKALIPSRRICGKRAKHALTQRLKVSRAFTKAKNTSTKKKQTPQMIACDVSSFKTSTAAPPQSLLAVPLISPLVHSREIQNQYWSRWMETPCVPLIAPFKMLLLDLPKEDQNLPLLSTGGSMLPPMNRLSGGLSQMDRLAVSLPQKKLDSLVEEQSQC
ncbi:unnamed protein product [Cylindrotheca closterium]|uniref:HSF-type DNA-binding domain-containing protein n=1 Tax=Cylindrotheca closterium TaxID=2856 RepID=A0AAD2CH99_9STRA|nr:unnamed protein product [Cylindrotheca closterium]